VLKKVNKGESKKAEGDVIQTIDMDGEWWRDVEITSTNQIHLPVQLSSLQEMVVFAEEMPVTMPIVLMKDLRKKIQSTSKYEALLLELAPHLGKYIQLNSQNDLMDSSSEEHSTPQCVCEILSLGESIEPINVQTED